MSKPRIVIDAMGGDHAPKEIVEGALLAAREYAAEIVLAGDTQQLKPLLSGNAGLRIAHAPDAIAMDSHATDAWRTSDRTSLGVAINMVKAREADAVVSAGNSGAFLAIALLKLGRIRGIARPAIATVWPGLDGPTVLLDSGANVDCRADWLLQFGIMGSAYAKAVLKIENPRVATLSIGEERSKGNQLVLEAGQLMSESWLNYIGNVEGKDLFHNVADVIVTDGFVGNCVLKTGEGLVADLAQLMKETLLGGSLVTKLGTALLAPALRGLRRKFDYETYGGAPLLGLRGNCIVTHGRAGRNAVKHAIHAAITEVDNDVVGRIVELCPPAPAAKAKETA
ncbi:MAG: phosphate acyltransferase PlsX [Vulcanimicrobiaceae bacterium]